MPESLRQGPGRGPSRITIHTYMPNADDGSHEWSVDGTHPDDYGYYLWTRSIEKPILRILRKYGIK